MDNTIKSCEASISQLRLKELQTKQELKHKQGLAQIASQELQRLAKEAANFEGEIGQMEK